MPRDSNFDTIKLFSIFELQGAKGGANIGKCSIINGFQHFPGALCFSREIIIFAPCPRVKRRTVERRRLYPFL